jgi:hypothetical protein
VETLRGTGIGGGVEEGESMGEDSDEVEDGEGEVWITGVGEDEDREEGFKGMAGSSNIDAEAGESGKYCQLVVEEGEDEM